MKRRDFLKFAGAAGSSLFLPSSLDLMSMYKRADASVNYTGAGVTPTSVPSIMPQVINIYLYGGPSELAGNLTNIVDIENNSQNSYVDAFSRTFGSKLLQNDTAGDGSAGQITKNGFWYSAGGAEMQFMLNQSYMSVYRTLHKVKDPERSHRTSILMNLKGSLNINDSAGVGSRVAALLYENQSLYTNVPLADGGPVGSVTHLTLPFVSFEGVTPAFALDPNTPLPLPMQSVSLGTDFANPYSRANDSDAAALDALVAQMETPAYTARYQGVVDAFKSRKEMAGLMANLTPPTGTTVSLTTDTSGDPLPTLSGSADITANSANNPTTPTQLTYPNNEYTGRIRAAVTLALKSPSSLYITVGGGLGGWDDHVDMPGNYPQRMASLMQTLQAAMLHIKYFNGTTLSGATRTTNDNIVINVFGDFGRQVNLNGSNGWDHGNNQNLYTFGGAGIRPAGAGALGKVVGTTERYGITGTNNQVTRPTAGSYQFEPMSVASTIYSYFGATNSAVLTADPTSNPQGDPVIDETLTGEPTLF